MTNLERRSFSYYEAVINELQLKESAQSAKIMDYEKRLCDVSRLANRVILIGEEEGWFEWKGDADNGGNHSSLHRDLTKVANQRVYKDFCDMHVKMINTLEQQIANLKHNYEAQEIIIDDYKKRINQLQAPKSCDGCRYFRKEYDSPSFENDCQRPISKNCSRRFKDYYEPKDK